MDIRRRNAVSERGQGARALVFANGFGCDQGIWRFVAPAFEADHRVVCFDYVGSGGADLAAYDAARYATLDGYAQDLVEVLDALALDDAVVVGHSVGATIAVLAARRRPARVAALGLLGPSPRYVDDPPGYAGGFGRADIEGLLHLMDHNFIGWAAALAPVIMKNAERPALAAELEQSFCSTDPEVARRFAEATFLADNRADFAGLAQPALVMQCADDSIAPDAVGAWLAAHMPRAVLRRMRATGHCPHLSHPEETVAVLRDFLDDLPPAA